MIVRQIMAQRSKLKLTFFLIITLIVAQIAANLPKVKENCKNCKKLALCPALVEKHSQGLIKYVDFEFCDLDRKQVCCERKLPNEFSSFAQMACKELFEKVKDTVDCSTDYILNGHAVAPKVYPHMVAIGTMQDDDFHSFCTGTLISDKFVLTASHCINDEEKLGSTLRLGETDNHAKSKHVQNFSIKNVIPYPNTNDLALLELNNSVSINDYVRPVCLPTTDGNNYRYFKAAGWGATQNMGDASQYLMGVELERFDKDLCENHTTHFSERTQLCAGSRTTNADTCYGDSGGPLFRHHPDYACLFMIYGITAASSDSYMCGKGADGISVGFYTRVYHFNSWIEDIVWKNYDSPAK